MTNNMQWIARCEIMRDDDDARIPWTSWGATKFEAIQALRNTIRRLNVSRASEIVTFKTRGLGSF